MGFGGISIKKCILPHSSVSENISTSKRRATNVHFAGDRHELATGLNLVSTFLFYGKSYVFTFDFLIAFQLAFWFISHIFLTQELYFRGGRRLEFLQK